MANVRLGGGVADLRGSIGGTTFSRGAAGAVARTRIKGVNRRTSRQQAQRSIFARLTSMWGSTAMDTYRAGWEQYAAATNFSNKVGDTIQISGLSCFVRTNSLRLLAAMSILTTAPTTPGFAPAVAPVMLAEPTLAHIVVSAAPDGFTVTTVDDVMLFFMSRPQSAGRNTPGTGLQYIGNIKGFTPIGPTFPSNLTPSYVMAVGEKVTIRTVRVSPEGKVSPDNIQVLTAANP